MAASEYADKFRSRQGIELIEVFGHRSCDSGAWTNECIDVLHELHGKPWDDIALLHLLAALDHPLYIRVRNPNQEETTDGIPGRVNVYLNEDDKTIRKINLEGGRFIYKKIVESIRGHPAT